MGTASWFVGVAHEGTLYDVTCEGSVAADATAHGADAPAGSVSLRLPGAAPRERGQGLLRRPVERRRRRAAARCWRPATPRSSGQGAYDLDGRSWVVAVFADASARLEHVTAGC